MNLFEINFISRMTALLGEAFKFKKYKAMHPAFAVFVGIFMLPVVVASFAAAGILAVLTFAFEVLSSPVKYVHGIVNKEGKEVKHATQAIVYLFSWPFVFAAYALTGLLLVAIFPIYALLSFLLYVWTLGGFKFHLFPVEDDIAVEVNGRYNFILPAVFIAVSAIVLIIVPAIDGGFYYAELYKYYREAEFVGFFFGGVYWGYIALHTAIAALYSLIALAPYPKAECVCEEPEVEALAEVEAPAEAEEAEV